MRTSFLRLLPAALLLAPAAGCLPNATWLPDSSGFVYTGGKNKDALYVYDLDKKVPRVLVEKGAGPAWPGVSPDGKRVAVVLSEHDTKQYTLEAAVFDRDGKELHRSAKLDWASYDPETSFGEAAQAFWVPGQEKLLLSFHGVAGFYDLKAKSSTKLDVSLSTFRNTPVRPDGKGFLAVKKDGVGLVFVDWDGKEQEIKPTDKDAFEKPDPVSPLQGMLTFPLMHSSRWDGSTAVVSWDDLRVKVDADKLTATLDHVKPALSEDKKVVQDQVQLAGGAVVRAVELTKRYNKDRKPDDPSFGSYRVEVVKPEAKEPKVLMDNAGLFLIDPSPDGKKAVVKCVQSKPAQDVLFVINGDGDVADTIDLAK